MTRVTMSLNDSDVNTLCALARRDDRLPRQEARYLLSMVLQQARLSLQGDPAQSRAEQEEIRAEQAR